ncbi:MAG: LysM peptidoglycan-binding domain-containing protein [Chitinophagales bacterium]|nr:LysM peptidoglycan-binding domain-containing protein [Bacteroidota bacterium]MCB9042490.1 LysM peptidoglycan-binding domain-containing protein [Chitinophagales bacterium]
MKKIIFSKKSSILLFCAVISLYSTNITAQNTNTTPKTHLVVAGESLYSIAHNYGIKLDALAAANGIDAKNVLSIGTNLIIPNKTTTVESAPMAKSEKPTATEKAKQLDFIAVENSPTADSFFEHIVSDGETLYGIAKRYDVQWPLLSRLNPNIPSDLTIKAGDRINIPQNKYYLYQNPPQNTATADYNVTANNDSKIIPSGRSDVSVRMPDNSYAISEKNVTPAAKLHTVAKGETLFAIAQQYGLSVAEVQQLNNMPDVNIKIGQQLIVSKTGGTTTATSAAPATSSKNATADFEKMYRYQKDHKDYYSYHIGKGKGAWIKEKGVFSDDLLALHRTIPAQTIIKVINPMNGRAVYVKVVGSLPDTGENQDIMIKLSPAAVRLLNLRDDNFKLEWSYYLPK